MNKLSPDTYIDMKIEMEKFAPLSLTADDLIDYTREWPGERFPDGRPKVPDQIIQRMRDVTITQAWGVLRGARVPLAIRRKLVLHASRASSLWESTDGYVYAAATTNPNYHGR